MSASQPSHSSTVSGVYHLGSRLAALMIEDGADKIMAEEVPA